MDQKPPVQQDQPQQSTKQQVVEALKSAQNVLVTVSANPSVDQLAACIGLTLMMNKLGKHATAVFSGQVPSTIDFLQPEKTLEANTDSLRDFIISLDRSKADKLRYKIEDNVVKIFITPYRTSLTEADLNYSQGDFNVDVVIALGVDLREHIDQAIAEHGRILHDAKVIGLSYGSNMADVGGIAWHEDQASSLCEMLVSISEAFQSGILDTQMATAFLTGIVAETERFSNAKTSPKVMTMSAQLMAAGANQQLIASALNPPQPEPSFPVPQPEEKKTDFEVPQEGEDGQDASAVIDLQEEDKTEQKEESPYGPNLTAPAPAVELGFPGQPDHGTPSIHIDSTGRIVEANQTLADIETETGAHKPEPAEEAPLDQPMQEPPAAEKARQAPPKADTVPDVPMLRGHEKVIEPLKTEEAPAEEHSSHGYIFEPPTSGGTFTGSTYDNPVTEAEDVSSLGATTHNDMPILSHEAHPEPSAEPAVPAENENPPAPEPPMPVSPAPEPPAPEPEASQPTADADSARKAVLDAMSSADYHPVKPDPVAALNAQPINLESPLSTPSSPSPAGAGAPPAVPPPLPPINAPVPDAGGELTLPFPSGTSTDTPGDPSALPPQQ